MSSIWFTPPSTGELRILVGGFFDEIVAAHVGTVVRRHLGYADVRVRLFQDPGPLLEAAAQAPPDLFLLYLDFGSPADLALADAATCRAEIHARLAQPAGQAHWVTECGLRLVTHLQAEFGRPVLVFVGGPHPRGLATRVEQAGAAALLPVPFEFDDCAATIGTCVEACL